MQRRNASTRPTPAVHLLDRAIIAMRGIWKGGHSSGEDQRIAISALRNIIATSAETHDVSEMLQSSIDRLERLPPEIASRRSILEHLATDLKAVRPLLGVTSPPKEVGKLNSSLGERRAGRPAPSKRKSVAVPRVLTPDMGVSQIPHVGDSISKKLEKLNITTIEDVLRLAPRRYIDYSNLVEIGSPFGLQGDVTIRGTIVGSEVDFGRKPGRFTIRLSDRTGSIRVTWFNTYLANQLKEGDEIFVSGTIRGGYNGLEIASPEWERTTSKGLSTGRLVPVYPSTSGLYQKNLRSITRSALDATRTTITDWLPDVRDFLDAELRTSLASLADTYEQLHYPDSLDQSRGARRRLMFGDLLLLQLGLLRRRAERQAIAGQALEVSAEVVHQFRQLLPFQLTTAQDRALREVFADLQRAQPMARLLQGDVGSGKTVVAAILAWTVKGNEKQTAIMAPTGLLAEQHLASLTSLFAPLPDDVRPTIALLTGSTRARARREVRTTLETGKIDVIVGTHALIQEDVAFHDLGLVVIDEQHRFGVRQRQQLADKSRGNMPHVLSMTATPIPRTLNFVLAGDLDVSIINERPPGRIPIRTRRYGPAERRDAYDLVRREVLNGYQAFVICPLVEESENLEARSAISEHERLQRDIFPDLKLGLVHGKMAPRTKDAVMAAFRDRAFDILVSTSVIEVGIDIPNATVMLIEGAERFGLSQLHQFRGRVGRGGAQSYCLLLTETSGGDSDARLETMVATDDGFVLAERDLELRGPGDFIGTRQSGLPELDWLQSGFDTRLLDAARHTAERIIEADPEISFARFPALWPRLQQFWSTSRPPDLTRT